MFKGSSAALVTPMTLENQIDLDVFTDLIDWQIASGTNALIIAGSTGEFATLTPVEYQKLITTAVKRAAKRIPVIAGTGTHCTRTSIELTKIAELLKVDACLTVVPYYNKPTQEGLFQHFQAIAQSTHLPIILYNVPHRTGSDLLPDTVSRLAEIENIIGIKEATGSVERARDIAKQCPSHFKIYSGDDATAADLMLQGASGTISVATNVVPHQMSQLCQLAMANEKEKVQTLEASLQPLYATLGIESNPIPVKWMLYRMGRIPAGIRLPLTALSSKHYEKVEHALLKVGITV